MVVFDLNFLRYAPYKMNRFTFVDIDCPFVSIKPMGHYFHTLRIRESVLRPALITVVSSSNIVKELSVQALSRSSMYSRKRKRPSIDPCGTTFYLSLMAFQESQCIVIGWLRKFHLGGKFFLCNHVFPVCVMKLNDQSCQMLYSNRRSRLVLFPFYQSNL